MTRPNRNWNARIAPVLLAVFAASAHADVTAERLPAEKAFGDAKKYTVSLHDLEAQDLVDAFAKQTGLAVRYQNSYSQRDGGPTAVYELDFADLSAREAVAELAKTLGLNVSPDQEQGDGFVISPDNYGPRREASSGKPQIELSDVSRRETLPASPNAGPPALSVTLQLVGANSNDPRDVRTAVGLSDLTIEEAVDEQGRTLEDVNAERRARVRRSENGPAQQVSLQFRLPSPRPTKMNLRGTVNAGRPKTVLRVAADSFDEGTMNVDCEGGTIRLGPPVASGRGFNVKLQIDRGSMDKEMFELMRRMLNENRMRPTFRGPEGESLRSNLQGTSWSENTFYADFNLQPDMQRVARAARTTTRPAPRVAQPEAVRPKTMQWDVVVETTDEPIKFEFKDVRVP